VNLVLEHLGEDAETRFRRGEVVKVDGGFDARPARLPHEAERLLGRRIGLRDRAAGLPQHPGKLAAGLRPGDGIADLLADAIVHGAMLPGSQVVGRSDAVRQCVSTTMGWS
jgi:hypothetical protein